MNGLQPNDLVLRRRMPRANQNFKPPLGYTKHCSSLLAHANHEHWEPRKQGASELHGCSPVNRAQVLART